MSEFSECKRHFRAEKVKGGNLHIPGVPDRLLTRWNKDFLEPLEVTGVPSSPRLINAYKLGADPEFIFEYKQIRINATDVGLQTGFAFGADMNGRLVEIRPAPSRFALEVLASTMITLRWLAIMHPETQGYDWKAGAFLQKDGLGGHVHFGRKKHNKLTKVWASDFKNKHLIDREPEWMQGQIRKSSISAPIYIRALDSINSCLLQLGVYPVEQTTRRQAGDQHGQHYGMPGDIRMQAHGFEYRAFPSWLDSPWMAYLTLVLAKLVVYDPELIPLERGKELDIIRNLLAFYKGLDDDARLAYAIFCKQGLPKYQGGDFRPRWGMVTTATGIPTYVPTEISPSQDDMQDCFALLCNTPFVAYSLKPSWSGIIPKGYNLVLPNIVTVGKKGLGEILCDAVVHTIYQPNIVAMEAGPVVTGYQTPSAICGFSVISNPRWGPSIQLPTKLREGAGVQLARKILYSGYFPVWKISEVKEDSYAVWAATQKVKKPQGYQNRIIYKG